MAAQRDVGRAFLVAANADGDDGALGDRIADAHAQAQVRWKLTVDPLAFARYLGARVDGQDLERSLSELHTTDLFLACACAAGDVAAIRAFDEEYIATLPAMVSRLAPPESVVDEVRQNLRDRLLVARPERAPAITHYAGRGALAGWLKVVAVRETMALLRRAGPAVRAHDEVALLSAPGHDPEFDLMRERYGEAFRTAFVAALLALPDRDRAVLREHLVERMSIDQIGSLHGVHRATAARWLVSIRDALYEGTGRELTRALQLEPQEYESILRLIRSQLHVTVGRHLT